MTTRTELTAKSERGPAVHRVACFCVLVGVALAPTRWTAAIAPPSLIVAAVTVALAASALLGPSREARLSVAAALSLSSLGVVTLAQMLVGEAGASALRYAMPPLAALIAARSVTALGRSRVLRLTEFALYCYVVASAVAIRMGLGRLVATDIDGIRYTRLALTGSQTRHAALCMLFLLITGHSFENLRSQAARAATLTVMLAAAVMTVQTGSRQVIVIATLAHGGWLLRARGRQEGARRRRIRVAIAVPLIGYAVLFAAGGLSTRLRLPATSYDSGRAAAIAYWVEQPVGLLGIGLGETVRQAAQGTLLPHNEFVRFYVEGGVFGLSAVALFAGGIVFALLQAVRDSSLESHGRFVAVACGSALLVQLALSNAFQEVALTCLLAILAFGFASTHHRR